MFLVIDNYDSFTYNLVQYLGELAAEVHVVRNDQLTLADIQLWQPEGIVISPGPGRPEAAGLCPAVLREFAPTVPMLGVCLGHQALGQIYGGQIVRAETLMHGKTSEIYHNQQGVFQDLPMPFRATRYHSLIIDRATCPACLTITGWTDDNTIMGVQHRDYPWVQGVQFHPESILTPQGKHLLQNFLTIAGAKHAAA